MRRVLIGLLLLVVVAAIVFKTWGMNPEQRLWALDAATGTIVWSTQLDALGRPVLWAPAADAERVVVWLYVPGAPASNDEQVLQAFDARTGSLTWQFRPAAHFPDAAGRGTEASPALIDDAVYVRVETKETILLVALDARTGAVRWSLPHFVSPDLAVDLVVSQDHIIVRTVEQQRVVIQALDPATGSVLWQTPLATTLDADQHYQYPLLAADAQTVFVSSQDTLRLLDAQTGIQRQMVEARGGVMRLVGDTLYHADIYGSNTLTARSTNGVVRWVYPQAFDDSFYMRLFAADPHAVYLLADRITSDNSANYLVAVDVQTGQERWRVQYGSDSKGGGLRVPVIDADAAYVIGEQHPAPGIWIDEVQAYALADGMERWRFPIKSSVYSAAIGGNHVLITDRSPRWRNWLARINPRWH